MRPEMNVSVFWEYEGNGRGKNPCNPFELTHFLTDSRFGEIAQSDEGELKLVLLGYKHGN